jgi:hypothetical protein
MMVLKTYMALPAISDGMTLGTQTLVNAIGSVPAQRAAQATDKALEKAAKVDAPKPAPATPVDAPSGATAPAAPVVESSTAEISYDTVSKAITDKVKVDKAHVVAVLAKFGAKKGPELKPEQYSEFLAAL